MGRHGARLRWVVALVSVTVAVLATVDRFVEREREWAHGGEQVAVTVEARLPEPERVSGAAATLGWPDAQNQVRGDPENQSVVLRLRWSGPSRAGRYQVILLDTRETPARVVRPYGGWDAAGHIGRSWADAYEALSERYGWLAGTAADTADPADLGGVPTRAVGDGSLVAVFRLGQDALPLTDPSRLVVAFCYVDVDGEVRWAKRVPVPAAP
ncbi:hypothetical protein C1I95_06775 [Micromonospora craterilacus]|uniref:Uncharacterized protein n=1 Tax=Micromonospora craterilacus TaxID=1655439 RepID=A0A2W2EZS5_9ACTN|nr:hypothetical protein [Micromonospora craterilacus]PZG21705.1 hypothetical protein C1I95_06775 [Micromonospora craterilacus]